MCDYFLLRFFAIPLHQIAACYTMAHHPLQCCWVLLVPTHTHTNTRRPSSAYLLQAISDMVHLCYVTIPLQQWRFAHSLHLPRPISPPATPQGPAALHAPPRCDPQWLHEQAPPLIDTHTDPRAHPPTAPPWRPPPPGTAPRQHLRRLGGWAVLGRGQTADCEARWVCH